MTISIKLDLFERQWLKELASWGGREILDRRKLKEETIKKLDELKRKECIKIEPTLELFKDEYVLTDIGRNIVEQIRKSDG